MKPSGELGFCTKRAAGAIQVDISVSIHERRPRAVTIPDGHPLRNALVADIEELAEREDLP